MINFFAIRDLGVHFYCSSVEILKKYMLICRNAEGVHGKQKVGNSCSKSTVNKNLQILTASAPR